MLTVAKEGVQDGRRTLQDVDAVGEVESHREVYGSRYACPNAEGTIVGCRALR